MDLDIASGHVYIGRGAGHPIQDAIDNAKKSIEITSPYLSVKFVKKLISKQDDEGVQVTLVTTTEFLKSKYAYAIGTALVRQKRHTSEQAIISRKRTRWGGAVLVLGGLVAAITAFLGLGYDPFKLYIVAAVCGLGGLGALVAAARTTIYSYTYEPKIDFVACQPWDEKYNPNGYLIHTKAYAIDRKQAYLGSCNFSYSGFSYNQELRLDLSERKDAEAISNKVLHMYRTMGCMGIPVERLGRMYYKEPRF